MYKEYCWKNPQTIRIMGIIVYEITGKLYKSFEWSLLDLHSTTNLY